MNGTSPNLITIQATINAPIDRVWKYWNTPEDIECWNAASPDWHCPKAQNDLRSGGRFVYTMAARDGSVSFDFAGVYTIVKYHELIRYTLEDGRQVSVSFSSQGNRTEIVEIFEAEGTHSVEMQQAGWQAILNNFKKFTER